MLKRLFLTCVLSIIPCIAFCMETFVTPGITVQTTYTDNVDRVNENPEDDFITTVSPFITMALQGKKSSATLSYAPSRVYYKKTRDNEYWRHLASLNAQSQLGRRVSATIGGTYFQSEDPADIEDADLTVRKGRFEYKTYTANAGLNYQFGAKDQMGLAFDYGRTENEDPELTDRQYYRPKLNLTYWFTNKWGTELRGQYERFEYDEVESVSLSNDSDDFDRYNGEIRFLHQFNRRVQGNIQYSINRVLYDGETEDERVHSAGAGFSYQLDQDMNLAVQLGYSLVERPELEDESDLFSDLLFGKRFQRGSLSLRANSGYDYDYYGSPDLTFSYYVGGGVQAEYQLFRRLNADVYADYRYTEYKDLIPQRNDDRFVAGCGLSFEVLRWLFVGAGYNYSTVESNYEENDYKDNRVYISLTATPSQPYRLGD